MVVRTTGKRKASRPVKRSSRNGAGIGQKGARHGAKRPFVRKAQRAADKGSVFVAIAPEKSFVPAPEALIPPIVIDDRRPPAPQSPQVRPRIWRNTVIALVIVALGIAGGAWVSLNNTAILERWRTLMEVR